MKKELLFSITKSDFTIQTFRSGGKGGQHQNKRDSGVRIIHKPSGAVGESRESSSQHRNKKIAFERLTKTIKFKVWLNKMIYEAYNQEKTEDWVNRQMEKSNLKVEVKSDGKWVDG